ncbi:hypothetical protein D3C80_1719290 [compost metagenome]
MFREEFLDCLLRQLDAHYLIALPRQPGQIQTLAAQRHQHPRARLQRERRTVALQIGVDPIQMKTDLIACPARLPECLVHSYPQEIRSNSSRIYTGIR